APWLPRPDFGSMYGAVSGRYYSDRSCCDLVAFAPDGEVASLVSTTVLWLGVVVASLSIGVGGVVRGRVGVLRPRGDGFRGRSGRFVRSRRDGRGGRSASAAGRRPPR